MCGIAGFIQINGLSQTLVSEISQKMGDALFRRGPDDFGYWTNHENIVLVHTRLSILDLSPSGHQPMSSSCGRYEVVFNGEIYNHLKLRSELPDSIQWVGTSDTETLVNALVFWGIDEAIKRLSGMFAIAIWDSEFNELFLVRDRMGEKPLFYYYDEGNGNLIFSSSLHALKVHPSFQREISIQALSLYLELGYVPQPYSIYKKTFKVSPGEIIKISVNQGSKKVSEKFWNLNDLFMNSPIKQSNTSLDVEVKKFDCLLSKAVEDQAVADVAIGAFLSGGVDSSLIVSTYSKVSPKPINTFTIGFDDDLYDEAPIAKKISKILGTNHHEYYLRSDEALSMIAELPGVISEPFGDSSLIPTLLVSKLASDHVKVCLTGDGGDELFGGYYRYKLINYLDSTFYDLPIFFRGQLSRILNGLSTKLLSELASIFKSKKLTNLNRKLNQLLHVISAPTPEAAFIRLVGIFEDPMSFLNQEILDQKNDLKSRDSIVKVGNFGKSMMFDDQTHYLPGDILAKVDAAGMYYSLEARIPFLSPNIVEYSWGLDMRFKKQKVILKKLLEQHIPKEIVYRKKTGFSIPLSRWIREDLREDFSRKLFGPTSKKFFNQKIIHDLWNKHMSCKFDYQNKLWVIYSFINWHDSEFKR
jgi:asparagine synthase (glutamine-hydrolysing)